MMVRVAVFLFWVAVLMLFNLHVELWQWHQVTVVGMAIIITMLTYSSHCANTSPGSSYFMDEEMEAQRAQVIAQGHTTNILSGRARIWSSSSGARAPTLQVSTHRWVCGWDWFHPKQPFLGLLFPQWLPESARYDVLSGNQEKAIATLKRIATENGAPMPLGKLIISRQVSAWPTGSPAWRPCACTGAGVLGWGMHVWVFVSEHGVDEGALGRTCKGNWATPICVFSPPSPKSVTWRI